MKNEQIDLYLGKSLTDKQSILEFLYDASNLKGSVTQEVFFTQLEKRESQGSIEIAEGVILPHFELEEISQTKIIIVRPMEGIINWSLKVKKVDVIVALFYKTGQNMNEIKRLMRMLADDSFVEDLKKKDFEELTKILRSKLCK